MEPKEFNYKNLYTAESIQRFDFVDKDKNLITYRNTNWKNARKLAEKLALTHKFVFFKVYKQKGSYSWTMLQENQEAKSVLTALVNAPQIQTLSD